MVLIDSSVWIEFFRGAPKAHFLKQLIELNSICVNNLILSELLPSILLKKEFALKGLLETVTNIPLKIDWDEIISMQILNLKKGINKVGIADLIIAQNVKQEKITLCSFDRHFDLMAKVHHFKLYKT